jgi:hypothetical protein
MHFFMAYLKAKSQSVAAISNATYFDAKHNSNVVRVWQACVGPYTCKVPMLKKWSKGLGGGGMLLPKQREKRHGKNLAVYLLVVSFRSI